VARGVLPGLRQVHAQVARYASAWEEANGRDLGSPGRLWVVLGDSTAQGIGAPSWDEGYVGQLRRALDAGSERPWRVINVSRSGARAADVEDRQVPLLEALVDEHPGEGFHDAVASLYIDAQAMSFMGYLGFAKYAKGQSSPEHSLLKLFGSETQRKAFMTGMEALGLEGFDRDHEAVKVVRGGSWADQYLRAFAATIAGGTSEIQRNIIAERVLGLPRR